MKKLVCVLIITMLTFFTACDNNDEPAVETSADAQVQSGSDLEAEEAEYAEEHEEYDVETSDDSTEEYDDFEETTAENDLSEEEIDDELATLKVSRDVAKGWTGIYLERGDNLYSLNQYITVDNSEQYHAGWLGMDVMMMETEDKATAAYWPAGNETLISFGNVPIASITNDDKIISFKSTQLRLANVVSRTGALPIIDTGMSSVYLIDDLTNEGEIVPTGNKSDFFTVTDLQGNPVEDYYNVNFGESYIVSWFVGTDYYERELEANCYCYQYTKNPGLNPEYEVDGELTKEGYATYDLSNVPSGMYIIIGNAGTGAGGGAIINIE